MVYSLPFCSIKHFWLPWNQIEKLCVSLNFRCKIMCLLSGMIFSPFPQPPTYRDVPWSCWPLEITYNLGWLFEFWSQDDWISHLEIYFKWDNWFCVSLVQPILPLGIIMLLSHYVIINRLLLTFSCGQPL